MPHPRTLTLCLLLAAVAFGLGVMSTLSPAPAADEPAAAEKPVIEKTSDELSYTLGYVISHRLAGMGVELDVPAFADGFKTARSDAPLKVSEQRMQALLDQFSKQRLVAEENPGEDDPKPKADERTAEEKRKAMAEQMQQRPMNAPPSATQLQIGGQVPKGRINAAVDTTQRVTREADAPDVREQQ